jgi:hypothetical protein
VDAMIYLCPVCGYDWLTEEPLVGPSASDEICPVCGIHFGYDDAAGGRAEDRAGSTNAGAACGFGPGWGGSHLANAPRPTGIQRDPSPSLVRKMGSR